MADESRLTVPPSDLAPLRRLAGLSTDAVTALAELFESDTDADRAALQHQMSERAGLPIDDAIALLDTLLGVELLRDGSDWTVAEMEKQLENAEGFPGKTRAERRGLAERVGKLLGHRVLSILRRAYFSLLANERTFRSAGVQSEVRPVFVGEEDEPAAALLLHQLEIAYYERASTRIRTETYTLDDRDVDNLLEVLESAKKRGATLRKTFSPTDLPFASPLLDFEGEQ